MIAKQLEGNKKSEKELDKVFTRTLFHNPVLSCVNPPFIVAEQQIQNKAKTRYGS